MSWKAITLSPGISKYSSSFSPRVVCWALCGNFATISITSVRMSILVKLGIPSLRIPTPPAVLPKNISGLRGFGQGGGGRGGGGRGGGGEGVRERGGEGRGGERATRDAETLRVSP